MHEGSECGWRCGIGACMTVLRSCITRGVSVVLPPDGSTDLETTSSGLTDSLRTRLCVYIQIVSWVLKCAFHVGHGIQN